MFGFGFVAVAGSNSNLTGFAKNLAEWMKSRENLAKFEFNVISPRPRRPPKQIAAARRAYFATSTIAARSTRS